MKTKVLTAVLLLLSIGLMAETTLYGAFRIKTKPSGADVNLYDIDQYLCETPGPAYPVMMDEYMELREGIPGRPIMLLISKEGYIPIRKEIFVPFLYTDIETALQNPTVFKFRLEDDTDRYYTSICVYYHDRRPRPRPYYGSWYINLRPWFPPGFGGYADHHHGHHGHGPWVPPPHDNPGGGHHPGIADYPPDIPGIPDTPPPSGGLVKPPNAPDPVVITTPPSTATNTRPGKVESPHPGKSPAPQPVVTDRPASPTRDSKPVVEKDKPKHDKASSTPVWKPSPPQKDKTPVVKPDKLPETKPEVKPDKQPEKKDDKKDEKKDDKAPGIKNK